MRSTRLFRPVARAGVVALVATAAAVGTLSTGHADSAPPSGTPSTVAADALPTAQVDGVVWKTAVVGSTVYAVGSFSHARPAGTAVGDPAEVPRANIMAFDLNTGSLLPFSHTLNAQALNVAPSPDGSRIYVTGDFTQVDGVPWSHLIAFNTSTGAIDTSFIHNGIGGTVRAVAVTADRVYVGGSFTTVGGQARSNAAAFDRGTGALTPWAPGADAIVYALAANDNSRILIGGLFQSLNGTGQVGIGAVDGTTGASLPWSSRPVPTRAPAPATNRSWVTDLVIDHGVVYGSNEGSGVDWFDGRWAADFATGDLVWLDNCYGATYGLAVSGQTLYSVGHAHDCTSLSAFPETPQRTWHRALAETTYATGTDPDPPCVSCNYTHQPVPALLHWFPLLSAGSVTGSAQAAFSVESAGGYLVLGGEFPRVNGGSQQGLVRFATSAVAPNKVGPLTNYETSLIPIAASVVPGTVRLSWISVWDYDNRTLRYDVLRDASNTPVYSTTLDTNFWTLPPMSWVDTTATPGATVQYRIRVTDAFGNSVTSPKSDPITVAATTPSAYAQDVIDDGAVDYWRLGESAGNGTVGDLVGDYGMTVGTGVTRGEAGAISSDSDTASTFDGTLDGLTATVANAPTRSSYSLEVWVKTTSTTGGKILGYGNSTSGDSGSFDRHLYFDDAGHIFFALYDGQNKAISSSATYNDGTWHHIVGTVGSAGMSLYVDGKRVTRDLTTTAATQTWPGYWRIGGDTLEGYAGEPTSTHLAGAIDEVAVYPGALSSRQVLDHFVDSGRTNPFLPPPTDRYGAAVYADDPDLFWRLNEAGGTTVTDNSIGASPGAYSSTGVTYKQGGAFAGSNAVRFNGVTGGAWSTASLLYNPTTYSEELWVKTTTTVGGKLIGFANKPTGQSSTNFDRHIYMTNAGKLIFGVQADGTKVTITSAKAFNDGAWHHVVATQGPSGMKLYVDNTVIGTNNTNVALAFSGFWRTGGDNLSGWPNKPLSDNFNGVVDEVAAYTTELSRARVKAHWLASGRSAGNVLPTARFTSSATYLTAAFDGTTSSDPDGTVASYAWNFGDGMTGTGAAPAHSYAAAGTYTVRLTVTDNEGGTATTTQPISVVDPPNQPPTAAFTSSVSELTAALDASGSFDPDGTLASYAWTFGDGATGDGQTTSHAYAVSGTYTVNLIVTDNRGGSSSVSHDVTVAANAAPTASFTSSVTDLAATLDASGSTDPDGTITSYAWDFGDGTSGSGAQVTHSYAAAGTYTVVLTVTDDVGATASTDSPVTVSELTIYAQDAFARTVATGWGAADKGGTWTTSGNGSNFSVDGSVGRLRMNSAGAGPSISLSSLSTATTDTQVTLSTDKAPTGAGITVSVVGRRVAGQGDYRGIIHLLASGTVNAGLVRADASGAQTTLAAEQLVPGLTYVVGDRLRARVQVSGANPTSLAVKVWKVGSPEPATWARTATDATAVLQATGGVALMSYLSGSATNAPVFTSFDDLVVAKP